MLWLGSATYDTVIVHAGDEMVKQKVRAHKGNANHRRGHDNPELADAAVGVALLDTGTGSGALFRRRLLLKLCPCCHFLALLSADSCGTDMLEWIARPAAINHNERGR